MIILRSLAALVALSCFTSCYLKSDLEAEKQRLSELKTKHRKLQQHASDLYVKPIRDIFEAREALAELDAKTDSIKASTEKGKLEIESLREEFATYRKSYRERLYASITKHQFPSLEIPQRGRIENAQIIGIHDGEIFYRCENERGRFSSSELPNEIRTYLMLDQEAADIEIFPEIVSASVIAPAPPATKPAEASGSLASQEIDEALSMSSFSGRLEEHTKKMDRLVDRRAELEASRQLINMRLSTLRDNRSKHKKIVRERGSYQSKRALRAIDELEDEIKARGKQINQKVIILNSLIKKARVSS